MLVRLQILSKICKVEKEETAALRSGAVGTERFTYGNKIMDRIFVLVFGSTVERRVIARKT